jgi:hypothetical protein
MDEVRNDEIYSTERHMEEDSAQDICKQFVGEEILEKPSFICLKEEQTLVMQKNYRELNLENEPRSEGGGCGGGGDDDDADEGLLLSSSL